MTESKAIELLSNATYSDEWQGNEDLTTANSMAIKALEEVQKYRVIGTPEECRAAVEKRKGRKPINNVWEFTCPKCGEPLIKTGYEYKFCDMCGQKLDWSDEE